MKKKAAVNIKWNFIDNFGQYIIKFVSGIIIARLLFPDDYGLVGMLSIFIAFSELFVSSGFASALIQKKNADKSDYSSVFFFNIFTGIIIAAAFFYTGDIISKFFNEARLLNIARVYSIVIILYALGIVPYAVIIKNINFKYLAKINLISVVISSSFGIYFAYTGFHYWALVFQQVIFAFLKLVLTYYYSKWKPNLIFNLTSLKKLLKFSLFTSLSGIFGIISNDLYKLVIGKYYFSRELGLYTQSKNLVSSPMLLITSSFDKVIFPTLAPHQDNNELLIKSFRKANLIILSLAVPVAIIILASSDLIINIFLTNKWIQADLYFKLLTPLIFIFPVSALFLKIPFIKGKAEVFFYLEVAKTLIIIISLLITVNYGVVYIMWGMFITSFIALYLNVFYTVKIIKLSIYDLLKDCYGIFVISALLLVMIYLIRFAVTVPEIFLFIIIIFVSVSFIIISYKHFNYDILYLIKDIFKKSFTG